MFILSIILSMFLGLVAQHFTVGVPGFGSHVLLLPLIFLCASAMLPLWEVLLLAFIGGLMWDCRTFVPIDGRADLPFGATTLLYAGLGAVMNGLRPLYLHGRWQVHVVFVGLLTAILALTEYLVITFRREPFALIWPREVWLCAAGSGLASLLLAIPAFIIYGWIGRRLGAFRHARIDD